MLFGRNPQGNGQAGPAEPPASEVARIQGGGLVQVIISSLEPMAFALFLNERAVSQVEVESLLVEIAAPGSEGETPRARATLTRYAKAVTGERNVQATELFPSTFQMLSPGRRIVVTCQEVNSLDGVWIGLGLKPDGTTSEVSGAQALRITVTQELLDARLTWTDGSSEDLLAASAGG